MAKSAGQKLKLLYIVKLLSESTDEHHPVSTTDIIAYLDANGIHSERKSIYDDIDKLCEFGYDIIQVHSRLGGGYYMHGRDFELAELKLLVDAVQASRFITTRKSRSLIKKLEQMAGKYDAGKLQRQVYVAGRIKTENESIYYNVDNIHRGIQDNVQITFQYLYWTLDKKLVPRKDGAKYKVSPWGLIWQDENYYLIGFDEAEEKIKHYRVDKMGTIELTEKKRNGEAAFERFDIAKYTNKMFGMFGGEECILTMQFTNRLIGVVLDRFGKDVDIRKRDTEHFSVRVKVAVSGQFFGWLTGLGGEAVILSPVEVAEEYKKYLQRILGNMEI